ncbi:helix-turn-helix domain-containing protein [Peptostreptococcus sp. D1]|uniref:helix-turn-helix domain-containing protein n=1 Tax=Peptostreptococcus sp. D1 TaxID=72304 RepID=UPI0008F39AAC|nr:helix-turn-helix transcriptional regulator [Peptostreptococcus sp. D1]SFE84762.1 hypothetical protein SAMN02910278_01872 [Peptostreptococcus sp. D1]
MNFKIEVKVALLKKNKSMKWLADELDISAAYLSDIINGNRKAEHYRKKIINILNIKEQN